MSRRVYTLKHKTTGLFLWGITYRKPFKDEEKSPRLGPKKSSWRIDYLERPEYFSALDITHILERMIFRSHAAEIDDLILEAFDIPDPLPFVPVKSTISIPTIKRRIEAKQIMQKLKAGR